MKYTVLDVETTTKNKGNPFTRSNRLMAVGLRTGVLENKSWKTLDKPENRVYNIEHADRPYSIYIQEIQRILDQTDWLIGFNLKFDIHWLRRYGVTLHKDIKIWDVQLGYFLLHHQEGRYPSLNDTSLSYGNPLKSSHIEETYWSKGIDTPLIPWNELSDYLEQDLYVTEVNFISQLKDYDDKPKKKKLVELQGLDLLSLEDMEFNGLPYDLEESKRLSGELDIQISNIDSELDHLVCSSIGLNYASNDDKSVLLFGGVITQTIRTPFIKKDGTVSLDRNKITKKNYVFPELVKPPKGSALKKAGYYSTDEGTLEKIKCSGKVASIITLLLRRAKLVRLNSTYYKGLPDLMEKMDWANVIHGSLNQCVAITGRLSSDNPNLQNNPEEIDRLFRSRFD